MAPTGDRSVLRAVWAALAILGVVAVGDWWLTNRPHFSARSETVDSTVPSGVFKQMAVPSAASTRGSGILTPEEAVKDALPYVKRLSRQHPDTGMTPKVDAVRYGLYTTQTSLLPGGRARVWIVTFKDVPNGCSTSPDSPFSGVGVMLKATGGIVLDWSLRCKPL